MDQLFDATTTLGKLGLLGFVMFTLVISSTAWVREWIVTGASHQREIARTDRALNTADAATTQFERALDVIERMQDRRRATDGAR